MGFFGFGKKDGQPKQPFNLMQFIILSIITVLGLQIFSALFGNAVGVNFASGPIFVLLGVGLAAIMGIAVFKKLYSDMPIDRTDMFAILIVSGIAFAMMFLLPDLVPEAFERSVAQLQAVIGLG